MPNPQYRELVKKLKIEGRKVDSDMVNDLIVTVEAFRGLISSLPTAIDDFFDGDASWSSIQRVLGIEDDDEEDENV